MARQDQMEALYEFFGGTPNTYKTINGTVFPDIKTIIKGEPLQKLQQDMPLLYVIAPHTQERRQAAQVKFIDYKLRAVLLWMTTGQELAGADRGASVLDKFYSLLDEIANKIRTNKQLITTSYPNGASVRFGEDFTIEEDHEVQNNMLLCVGVITISSTEQVFA